MKFRLEPTLVLQTISAALAFLVTFGFDFLSADQAGLIVALIAAAFGVVNALKVRPVAPAVFQTLITTGAALLTTYGLDFSQERIGAFQLLVVAVVAMLTRNQVTPAAVMNPTVPAQGTVA
jgi:membrane-bound ClpP family serine protease